MKMSKPRYPWHGYIRTILKRFPNVSEKEKAAIEKVIEDLKAENETDVLNYADLYYFKKKYDTRGTAKALFVSYGTVLRWNRKLIERIAYQMGIMP